MGLSKQACTKCWRGAKREAGDPRAGAEAGGRGQPSDLKPSTWHPGDASGGMRARKRGGARGHAEPTARGIQEKGRNTAPGPVLGPVVSRISR